MSLYVKVMFIKDVGMYLFYLTTYIDEWRVSGKLFINQNQTDLLSTMTQQNGEKNILPEIDFEIPHNCC